MFFLHLLPCIFLCVLSDPVVCSAIAITQYKATPYRSVCLSDTEPFCFRLLHGSAGEKETNSAHFAPEERQREEIEIPKRKESAMVASLSRWMKIHSVLNVQNRSWRANSGFCHADNRYQAELALSVGKANGDIIKENCTNKYKER